MGTLLLPGLTITNGYSINHLLNGMILQVAGESSWGSYHVGHVTRNVDAFPANDDVSWKTRYKSPAYFKVSGGSVELILSAHHYVRVTHVKLPYAIHV